MVKNKQQLKRFLDSKVEQYNCLSFIENDPISVPHSFQRLQDIEIAGFFAALFAWGKRSITIQKTKLLMQLMDNAPYDFILHYTANDLRPFKTFKHRTFQPDDVLYFLRFLQHHYRRYSSLETAFTQHLSANDIQNTEQVLIQFHKYFFSLKQVPQRTFKHIASPAKQSNCKRLNMFLRWMVRKDNNGVDFGIWHRLQPSQLICPVDVHVARVAYKLNLLSVPNSNWNTAQALTQHLQELDANDPVQYDFALFGLGIEEHFAE